MAWWISIDISSSIIRVDILILAQESSPASPSDEPSPSAVHGACVPRHGPPSRGATDGSWTMVIGALSPGISEFQGRKEG